MTTDSFCSAEYVGHVPVSWFYTFNEYDAGQPEVQHKINPPTLCPVYRLDAEVYKKKVDELFCIVKDSEARKAIKGSLPKYLGDQIPKHLDGGKAILHSFQHITTGHGGTLEKTQRLWTAIGDTARNRTDEKHFLTFWRHSEELPTNWHKSFPVNRKGGQNQTVQNSIADKDWKGPLWGNHPVIKVGDHYQFATNNPAELPEEMRAFVKKPEGDESKLLLAEELKVVASREEMLQELSTWNKKPDLEKGGGFLVACPRKRKDGKEKLEIWHSDGSKPNQDQYASDLPAVPKLLIRFPIIIEQPKKEEAPGVDRTNNNKTPANNPTDGQQEDDEKLPSGKKSATTTPAPAQQSWISWLLTSWPLTPVRWLLGLCGIKV